MRRPPFFTLIAILWLAIEIAAFALVVHLAGLSGAIALGLLTSVAGFRAAARNRLRRGPSPASRRGGRGGAGRRDARRNLGRARLAVADPAGIRLRPGWLRTGGAIDSSVSDRPVFRQGCAPRNVQRRCRTDAGRMDEDRGSRRGRQAIVGASLILIQRRFDVFLRNRPVQTNDIIFASSLDVRGADIITIWLTLEFCRQRGGGFAPIDGFARRRFA